MNNFVLIVVSQVVEAEAVRFFINQFFEPGSESHCLGFIHTAFKDGVLYSLAVGRAAFSYLAESFPSCGGGSIHVIGYKEEHGITSRRMADSRPNHAGCIEPAEGPARRE